MAIFVIRDAVWRACLLNWFVGGASWGIVVGPYLKVGIVAGPWGELGGGGLVLWVYLGAW